MAPRLSIVSLFRFLARISPLALGAAYTLALTVVSIFGRLGGRSGNDGWFLIAGLIALIAFSLLFTTVTWYRDDDTLAAAVLIVVATGVGAWVSQGVGELLFTGSLAGLALIGAVFSVGLFIRAVLFVPILMFLIWVGRRLRRFFAPATVNDERLES